MTWKRERRTPASRERRPRNKGDTMKAATTITTTILVLALGAGLASAQSPTIIQNTRNQMNGVSNHATAASNAALDKSQTAPATVSVKPAPAKGSAATTSTGTKTAGAKTKSAVAIKPAAPLATGKAAHAKVGVAVKAAPKKAAKASAPVTAKAAVSPATSGSGENTATEQPVVPDSKATARGRRD